jgi:tetratricopeptide (TPR) repeat protein
MSSLLWCLFSRSLALFGFGLWLKCTTASEYLRGLTSVLELDASKCSEMFSAGSHESEGQSSIALFRQGLCYQYFAPSRNSAHIVPALMAYRTAAAKLDHDQRSNLADNDGEQILGSLKLAFATKMQIGVLAYQLDDAASAVSAFDEAEALLHKVEGISGTSALERAELYYNRADVVHVLLGDPANAVGLYNTSLSLDPHPCDLSVYWKYVQAVRYSTTSVDARKIEGDSHPALGNTVFQFIKSVLSQMDDPKAEVNRKDKCFLSPESMLATNRYSEGTYNQYLSPMRRQLARSNNVSLVHYAAFIAADLVGLYDDAFPYLQKARLLDLESPTTTKNKRRLMSASIDNAKMIMNTFRKGFWSQDDTVCRGDGWSTVLPKSCYGDPTTVPVFIMGFFRSGSSILESLLSAHSSIYGIGEENILSFAMQSIAKQATPQNGRGSGVLRQFSDMMTTNDGSLVDVEQMRQELSGNTELSADDVNLLARTAVDEMMKHAQASYSMNVLKMLDAEEVLGKKGSLGATEAKQARKSIKRVISKLLVNYRHFGLLHLMYPNAVFLHTVRDPMDTLFSCYKTKFSQNATLWAYDDEQFVLEYVLYLKLMQHFRSVLPRAVIVDVRYEELMADPEAVLKPIVTEKLQLPWEPQILDRTGDKRYWLHKTHTASIFQVRQQLYKTSIGYWTKYAAQLQPLVRTLQSSLLKHQINLTFVFGDDESFPSMNWNQSVNFDYEAWFVAMSKKQLSQSPEDTAVAEDKGTHEAFMSADAQLDAIPGEDFTSLKQLNDHLRIHWGVRDIEAFLFMKPFEYAVKKEQLLERIKEECKIRCFKVKKSLALHNCSRQQDILDDLVRNLRAVHSLSRRPEVFLPTSSFTMDHASAALLAIKSAISVVLGSVSGIYQALEDLKLALTYLSAVSMKHKSEFYLPKVPVKVDDFIISGAQWNNLQECYFASNSVSSGTVDCSIVSFGTREMSLLYYMVGDTIAAADSLPPHYPPLGPIAQRQGPTKILARTVWTQWPLINEQIAYFRYAVFLEPFDLTCMDRFLGSLVRVEGMKKRPAVVVAREVQSLIPAIGRGLTNLDPDELNWQPRVGIDVPIKSIERGSSQRAGVAMQRMASSGLYWNLYRASHASQDYELAWTNLHTAHKLDAHKLLQSGYNNSKTVALAESFVNIYRSGFWMNVSEDTVTFRTEKPLVIGTSSVQPIFIVGFPQSGSRLLQSMICFHPQIMCPVAQSSLRSSVVSMGAFVPMFDALHENVANISKSLRRKGNIDLARNSLANSTVEARALLLRALDDMVKLTMSESAPECISRLGGDMKVIIDMTGHHEYIGLIHQAFPEAPILHAMRDPMDTLFSAYRTKLTPPATNAGSRANATVWAVDMESAIVEYASYLKLMQHYRKHLPGRFVDVSFEVLVASAESLLRALFEHHIRLPDAFLDDSTVSLMLSGARNHKDGSAKRNKAASAFTWSLGVGGWIKYKKQLEGVTKALRQHVRGLGGRHGGDDVDSLTLFRPVADASHVENVRVHRYVQPTSVSESNEEYKAAMETAVRMVYGATDRDISQNWMFKSDFNYKSLVDNIVLM